MTLCRELSARSAVQLHVLLHVPHLFGGAVVYALAQC